MNPAIQRGADPPQNEPINSTQLQDNRRNLCDPMDENNQ